MFTLNPTVILAGVLAFILTLGGTAWFSYDKGVSAQKGRDAIVQTQILQTAIDKQHKADAAAEVIDNNNAYNQGAIEAARNAIPQEITRYVTAKADADCVLNNGSLRVLDAAGLGITVDQLPKAVVADSANSGVRLSTAVQLLGNRLNDAASFAKRLQNASDAWSKQQELVGAPAK